MDVRDCNTLCWNTPAALKRSKGWVKMRGEGFQKLNDKSGYRKQVSEESEGAFFPSEWVCGLQSPCKDYPLQASLVLATNNQSALPAKGLLSLSGSKHQHVHKKLHSSSLKHLETLRRILPLQGGRNPSPREISTWSRFTPKDRTGSCLGCA